MKRGVKIGLLILGLVMFGIVLTWFIIRVPNTSEPSRHRSVPKYAVWSGGVDGGFWFDYIESKTQNKVHLKIFNDYSGELVLDADFLGTDTCLIPQGRKVLDSINYFEFDKIVLLNGCELKVVYPAYGGTYWEMEQEKQSPKALN
ncbi:MAG: hypothetical protein L6Q78_14200 [Bacteroidia bacterium]|nr:hypothetical protein [Bacteroidia bacterium]